MVTNEAMKRLRVRVVDRKHPHFDESGKLTGEVVTLFGEPMAKLALDNCRHGTDACFVTKGQIDIDRRKR